jgi:CRP-like cAMP-binding protein
MTLAKFLGSRQRKLEQRLLDVVTKNAQKRLADLLLQLGESYGVQDARGILLRIKLSQSALGNLLGVSREIVNHTFSDLRRRGVIEIAEGRVVIQDPEALAALAA